MEFYGAGRGGASRDPKGQGWGEKVFLVMLGGTGMGQDKTMRGGDEDPILRPRPAPLPSLKCLVFCCKNMTCHIIIRRRNSGLLRHIRTEFILIFNGQNLVTKLVVLSIFLLKVNFDKFTIRLHLLLISFMFAKFLKN